MKIRLTLFVLSLAMMCGVSQAPAQTLAQVPQAGTGLTFKQFMQAVLEGNVGLASQKYNVDIADAAISVAALAPDPTFTFGYTGYELSRFVLPRSVIASINYTLENSDKRAARVIAATADKSLAEAQVNDYLKTLRFDAANAFVESLRARTVLDRRKAVLEVFENLDRNVPRGKSEPAVKQEEQPQLRLELARLRGEFHQAEADAAIAAHSLHFYLGESFLNKADIYAAGRLDVPEIRFNESELLSSAPENRADIISGAKALDAARAKSQLARENRKMDFGLTLGVIHTQPLWAIPDAGGTYSPGSYPMSNSLLATVTVPIPFSLLQDGDVRGPAAAATQAELRLRDLHGKARIEIQQAVAKYRISMRQVAAYQAGTRDADILMQDTLKKFAGRETGFPDIVYYVRTANEIHFAYLEALAASLKNLISVYQTTGQWQFDL